MVNKKKKKRIKDRQEKKRSGKRVKHVKKLKGH